MKQYSYQLSMQFVPPDAGVVVRQLALVSSKSSGPRVIVEANLDSDTYQKSER